MNKFNKLLPIVLGLAIAGCATPPKPKNVPKIFISPIERKELIDSRWVERARLQDSIYDERIHQTVMFQIVLMTISECTSREYKILQVDKGNEDKNETWMVDVCGEKKVVLDKTGYMIRFGNYVAQRELDAEGRMRVNWTLNGDL